MLWQQVPEPKRSWDKTNKFALPSAITPQILENRVLWQPEPNFYTSAAVYLYSCGLNKVVFQCLIVFIFLIDMTAVSFF